VASNEKDVMLRRSGMPAMMPPRDSLTVPEPQSDPRAESSRTRATTNDGRQKSHSPSASRQPQPGRAKGKCKPWGQRFEERKDRQRPVVAGEVTLTSHKAAPPAQVLQRGQSPNRG
jgi:hypothetical protein